VLSQDERERFERVVMPHLDAAYNFARWLLRSRADAEDVAQEALVRAWRFFGGYHGGDPRAWLLQIVRNSCYTWLEKNRAAELATEFDENLHGERSYALSGANEIETPEAAAVAADERERLTRALESLAPRSREVLVLRELEGYSYKEIAAIVAMPIGTVMSTLARAREKLQSLLREETGREAGKEVRRGM
jgi:RNA polymerase sigma-70 factor (ECF subfamily)